jgi:DNA processing protein
MIEARDIMIYLAIKYNGDWCKIYEAVTTKEPYTTQEVIDTLNCMTSKAITIFDKNIYPEFFKHIPYPPFVLFYHGDISLIKDGVTRLGIVGSRKNSLKGEWITKKIVKGLDDKVVVVSGLAIGIDSIAHQAAIMFNKKTIAILGCGVDLCYTKSNIDIYEEIKANHLVLSEYPGSCEPKPENFPFRNRIIAALSNSLLVTEAEIPSGTSTTVNYALNYGKNIMCVPYFPIINSGCNTLIKDGAILVTNADDVMENLKIKK